MPLDVEEIAHQAHAEVDGVTQNGGEVRPVCQDSRPVVECGGGFQLQSCQEEDHLSADNTAAAYLSESVDLLLQRVTGQVDLLKVPVQRLSRVTADQATIRMGAGGHGPREKSRH